MDKKLDTSPYKGVRDFYPEDMRLLKSMFQTLRTTVEKYGYTEYGASILEPADLYKAKSGDEIVNEQTYTFTDRGDREVTLRPEMTPTVARMVAGRKRDLGFPLRWYSIPNLFRYENPQRGRLREHFQLNVDLFGVKDLSADIEIISIAHSILHAFGAKDEDFEIRINSRVLLESSITAQLKNANDYKKALRLIDRKDKMSAEEFTTAWSELSDISFDSNFIPNDAVNTVLNTLVKLGIKNAMYAPTLARGLDYYSDIVFEVFDTNPDNKRSLFGGGRYDGLLELFGSDTVPAVGFGMGDVTLLDFLESHNLVPKTLPECDAMIVSIGAIDATEILSLAESLREKGLRTSVNTIAKKPADAIKVALKHGLTWMIFVGEDEIAKKEYTVKNLATEETFSLGEAELIDKICAK